MRSSERGAAQVNILFMIFPIVLLLGTGLALWTSMGAIQDERAKTEAANRERDQADQRYDAIALREQNLAAVVGFRASDGGQASDPAAITTRIDALRQLYPNRLTGDATTLEVVIDRLNAAHESLQTQFAEKERSLTDALSGRESAEDNLSAVTSAKDGEIQTLRDELTDEKTRASNEADQLNQRISALETQVNDAQLAQRDAEDRLKAVQEDSKSEIDSYKGRISELASKVSVFREPDRPDGKILKVSDSDGLVYIDIGGNDMLRRGTRFMVFDYGKGGIARHKGWVEVRELFDDHALAGIVSQADALNPLVAGDHVSAPYFDRNLQRNFVLAGRFPAGFDKSFVTRRLESFGAKVDDKVSAQTDFLILGEKELGEFAAELSDTDDYKLAEKFNVQMLPVKELIGFIRY